MKQRDWMNFSDIMAVLMMMFLFISISYMYQIKKKSEEIDKALSLYNKNSESLNKSLKSAFNADLNKWKAIISDENSIIFKDSNLLFYTGSSKINNKFKLVIDSFFPKFIKTIEGNYLLSIDYIEINGHSSSEWGVTTNKVDVYLYNLNLSQLRAFQTLKYSLKTVNTKDKKWILKKLRSKGVSSSQPIYSKNKKEDKKLSRRVEFKIVLKSKEILHKQLNH